MHSNRLPASEGQRTSGTETRTKRVDLPSRKGPDFSPGHQRKARESFRLGARRPLERGHHPCWESSIGPGRKRFCRREEDRWVPRVQGDLDGNLNSALNCTRFLTIPLLQVRIRCAAIAGDNNSFPRLSFELGSFRGANVSDQKEGANIEVSLGKNGNV